MSSSNTSSLSFIGIVDFTEEAKFLYVSESSAKVLGWEPKELIGMSGIGLAHPDEILRVRKLHLSTITADGAAAVVYMRMRHKDPSRGYILCLITRTIVHNVMVGSVSYASHSLAMHMGATAQRVDVISPEGSLYAKSGRWTPLLTDHTKSSSPSSDGSKSEGATVPGSTADNPDHVSHPRSSGRARSNSIELQRESLFIHEPLPNQSHRTLFILDRYTPKAAVLYCSNDLLVPATEVVTRSFYDFVYEQDEEVVRTWITQVKHWGINDFGQPTDSGFGYAWFTFLTEPRDSSARERIREPEPAISSGRTRMTKRRGSCSNLRAASLTRSNSGPSGVRFLVDAILSAHSDGVMVVLRKRVAPGGGADLVPS